MGHENTITVEMDGRFFNVPQTARRSGKQNLPAREAVKRARQRGMLGKGFPTLDAALKSARARSNLAEAPADVGKAPGVTGGRVRRRHRKQGISSPFNPGASPFGR